MPVAYMDTNSKESETSFSGQESPSESPSEWVWDETGPNRRSKRKERNRNAARRSRRKQTERADQLHGELQALERSNAEYEREIAELKLEVQRYTTALEHHQPHCSLLRQPPPAATSSTTLQSASNTPLMSGPSVFSDFPSADVPAPEPLLLPDFFSWETAGDNTMFLPF